MSEYDVLKDAATVVGEELRRAEYRAGMDRLWSELTQSLPDAPAEADSTARLFVRVQITPTSTTMPVLGYYLYGEHPQPQPVPAPRLAWWRRLAIRLLGGEA